MVEITYNILSIQIVIPQKDSKGIWFWSIGGAYIFRPVGFCRETYGASSNGIPVNGNVMLV